MPKRTAHGIGDDYIGPLERRVMEHLWRRGPASVAQVADAFNATSDRRLAYTTVMTILARLYVKGYATRRATGRSHLYEAAMDEAELKASVGRRELSHLIHRYGAASLAQFAEDLTEAEPGLADRLRGLAARLPRGS